MRLATEIELNYANFDAFIVLHGTVCLRVHDDRVLFEHLSGYDMVRLNHGDRYITSVWLANQATQLVPYRFCLKTSERQLYEYPTRIFQDLTLMYCVDCHRGTDTSISTSKWCCGQFVRLLIHRGSIYYPRRVQISLNSPWQTNNPKEVCLYFNHRLFRGNRVSKISSFDLEAFASPNYPPLVEGISSSYYALSVYHLIWTNSRDWDRRKLEERSYF